MNRRLQNWFNLTILHSYFVDNVCSALVLNPIAETKRSFRQFNLLSRDSLNQFQLYASYNANTAFSWTGLTSVVKELYFFIINGETNFLNYTNIPFEITSDSLYYFTNTKGTTQVQKQSMVGAADQVSLTDLQFSILIPDKPSVIIKIIDSFGKTVINQTVNGQEQNQLIIDLNNFGSGYYEMYQNGKLKQSFLALADIIPSKCFGILRVDLTAISPEQAKKLPFNCQLNFETRSTLWQYQVAIKPESQIQVEQMSITSSDGYTYSGPVKEKIVGGNKASVYISTTPIPLEEQSTNLQTLKVIYKNQYSTRKNEMDIKLPFPDVSSIQAQSGKKKQNTYVSNKIVYV